MCPKMPNWPQLAILLLGNVDCSGRRHDDADPVERMSAVFDSRSLVREREKRAYLMLGSSCSGSRGLVTYLARQRTTKPMSNRPRTQPCSSPTNLLPSGPREFNTSGPAARMPWNLTRSRPKGAGSAALCTTKSANGLSAD